MNRFLELTPGKFAHASGALWLEEPRAALLADVHLGYGWALRRRGQLGPVLDGGVTERLRTLVRELRPKRLVFLGDLVHAPRPGEAERELIERALLPLVDETDIVVVTGNHDRAFEQDFAHLGLTVVDEWQDTDLVAVHGDREIAYTDKMVAVGHHHPAFGIRDGAGVKQKVPVFLTNSRTFVLPAFSPFASGVDVSRGLSPALKQLFGREPVLGVAATGRRTVLIGRM